MVGIYHRLCRYLLIQPKHLQTFPDHGFCFKFENQPGIVERFRDIFKLAVGPALSQAGFVSKPGEWFLNDEKQWISVPILWINQNQQWLRLQEKIPMRSGKLRDFSGKVRAVESCRSHISLSSCRAPMKINSSSFWAGIRLFLLLLSLAPDFCWKCLSSSNAEFSSFPKMNLVQGWEDLAGSSCKDWWAKQSWRAGEQLHVGEESSMSPNTPSGHRFCYFIFMHQQWLKSLDRNYFQKYCTG